MEMAGNTKSHPRTKLVASFTIFIVVVLFVKMSQVRGHSIDTKTFSLLKDVQFPPRDCEEESRSRPTGTVQCASACDVMATCHGFSFTCTALDPGSSCRCFLCFTADVAASASVAGVTSGVLLTQQSSSSFPASPALSAPSSALSPSNDSGCPMPPLIARTAVSVSVTSSGVVAHYTCSVSTDVYAKGTADVTCSGDGTWSEATILCAPTTCWYQHAHWGPVYGGNLSVTEDGEQCQPWALNYPQTKNLIYEPDSMYPSDNDNKTAASNYCRIFDDDYTSVWCYWNQPSSFLGLRKFSDCNVPQCGSVEGQRLP